MKKNKTVECQFSGSSKVKKGTKSMFFGTEKRNT